MTALRDQAAVDMERRDAWRKTLDREIQLNTMQIDQMRAAADRGLGFGIAAPLLQFIAREGWKIGYAANGAIVRWDSLREWIEDYPDNGGLRVDPHALLGHDPTVDLDPALVDQHLARPPAAQPCGGEHLLQPDALGGGVLPGAHGRSTRSPISA